MPKIISKKKLTRYPITIFKYVKSQYYWYRFWVNKSYKNNRGIEEKSTLEIEFRRAEKKAIEIYKNFDFIKHKESEKKEINFHKDIAVPYFNVRKQHNHARYKKELGQYNNEILPILKDIDYRNIDDFETAITTIFFNLKSKNLAVATCRNYKIILTNMCSKALKNNNVPLDIVPEFPKLKGNSLRRLAYLPKEKKLIRNAFINESKVKEDSFYDETADYLSMLDAGGGARPGLELLKVRRSQISFINDPNNPKEPIMKCKLFETKKDEHKYTLADWFRDDVYPNIINRYPNAQPFDYLFFPKEENRDKVFNRIRKNFVRISDNLGLYVKDGQNRSIYVWRHGFISTMGSKGIDANVLAIHSNTGVQMINKHYTDLSDDNLVKIHNQLYPKRTTNSQNNIKTKK